VARKKQEERRSLDRPYWSTLITGKEKALFQNQGERREITSISIAKGKRVVSVQIFQTRAGESDVPGTGLERRLDCASWLNETPYMREKELRGKKERKRGIST